MTYMVPMTHIDDTGEQAPSTTRILVVEDDLNLLEGLRNILEIDGYEVLTADDGRVALNLLYNLPTPPDLILSDIMMPYMSGIELLEAVRQEARWLSIPFIFLTARGEKADIQRGKELGVEDYIVKPYDPIDLLIILRARLKRSEEIETAHTRRMTELKHNILTILNHEFRTPLTFVVAYADMLNIPDPDKAGDAEVLTFLKGVSSGAERLRSLIENFILMVELEAGEAEETYQWRKTLITEPELLLEIARKEVFGPDDVRHTCDLRIEPPLASFVGDEDYLRCAIVHLLSNAIKFSPPESPVVLTARMQDDYVTISITDQGRGIPPDELDNIWDSFYQIDRAFYEDQGAGSGLPIVKRIVALHGGKVSVDSTVDKGSTFTIWLPVAAS